MRKLLFALALASACSKSEPPAPATATAPTQHAAPAGKDPEAARQLIAQDAVVIDVRTPEEFAEGHVRKAKNIPVDEVSARLAEIDDLVYGDKRTPIVVYCAKGSRAAKAKTILEGAGHVAVINGGGYDDLR